MGPRESAICRRIWKWTAILLISGVSVAATPKPQTLVVYTYDSMMGKGSFSEWLGKNLDPKLNVKIDWKPFSTGGEAGNQVLLEGAKTQADIVLGLDDSMSPRLSASELFEPNPQQLFEGVSTDLMYDSTRRFVPYDYGYISILYNKKRSPNALAYTSFAAFAKDATLKKQLVIQDPRTSTIGNAFLLWTYVIAGDKGFEPFWTSLAQHVRTVSPGWSAAYGAFTKGDANFVVSYSTSPAYHLENDPPETRQDVAALVFEEGHYRQVELAAIVKSSKKKELARKWIAALLSESAQKQIPSHQYMYPARSNTPLPASYSQLPKIEKIIVPPRLSEEQKRQWIHTWSTLMANTL